MKKPFNKLSIDKQIKLINTALETDVLPMLMSHGGGLEIMDIEDWKIIVQYFGACQGCPLSSSGTLEFIQQVLQGAIDERIYVVPA
jgi:NFU1 iron-sulfur cluster scaffold homolog, mitochondrial